MRCLEITLKINNLGMQAEKDTKEKIINMLNREKTSYSKKITE